LVVDTFCGWGTTGVAALKLGRVFLGCERIPEDAKLANERCLAVISQTNLVKVAGR
jgi:DNA modification methylase